MNLDKDNCKDKAFLEYEKKCRGMMALPMGLTMIQMASLSQDASIMNSAYLKLRVLKTIALGGALVLCLNETSNFKKQLTYYDRFYPEMTGLQKQLTQEA